MAVGDFNRDGHVDLAVVQQTNGNVSFYYGSGDGNFFSSFYYATGQTLQSISAADLNQDGNLDVAVPDGFQQRVRMLFGNGDGTFYEKSAYSSYPYGLALGDFDANGILDIATSNEYFKSVSILPGPYFQAVDYATEGYTYQLVSADFDEDGKLDLLELNGNQMDLLMQADPELSKSYVHFGRVEVGKGSPDHKIIVRNQGHVPFTINSITISDSTNFRERNNCGTSLDPAQFCTIHLRFKPTGRGHFVSYLSFSAGLAPGYPKYVPLSGNGR